MNENKLKIHWFPGHMTKALRLIESELKNIDVVIYVLDARAPLSCINPSLDNLTNNKPILYVLNKEDLANSEETEKYIKFLKRENTDCVSTNSTLTKINDYVITKINSLCKQKIDKYKEKNINITIKAMVVGVPNCGKSTLINSLCNKAKTVSGNKPGVTRGKQWVRISNNIELLDMPGTLWPSFSNQTTAKNLAYIGSIKDDVLDINELSLEFIKDIINLDKTILEKRYNIKIENQDEPVDILEKIGYSRKFLIKGGEIDYDRTSFTLLDEFRKGKLGRITLKC